jgi:anti-sigma factor RsiW
MLVAVWPAALGVARQSRPMAERNVFADEQIQEYIDGRLNERDRAAVAAYLLAHPRVAAEVETVRRQSEALRALGQEILDEPIPEQLRRLLRERTVPARGVLSPGAPRPARRPIRRAPGFLDVAMAILVFCAGGAIGWFAHGGVRPAPSLENMLLANMTHAFIFYGARDYPVAFPPHRAEEFLTWIGRLFNRDVRPPDLAEFGYSYRGGRLIPTAGTSIGLFQFERSKNARLAVFFWTTAAPPTVVRVLDDRPEIAGRFWTRGLSFAVISDKANRDLEEAARAIFAFYGRSLSPS